MATDDGNARSQLLAFMMVLDGARPSGTLGWVSPLGAGPPWLDAFASSAHVVVGVRSGLRRPRRLTALAIADEAPNAVIYVLRAAKAEPL